MTDTPRDRNAAADEGRRAENQSGSQKRRALVAVDLGAESCRVSLLRWVDGRPEIELAYRFANSAADDGSGLRWDIRAICEGVETGLRICARLASEGIAAVGVDGWAVDYVRLRPDGQPIASPFCYRDERTIAAQKRVHSRISPDRLYALTGVQILSLNTLYQLAADRDGEQALPWINVPEFVMHRLGGKRVSEYTNATHTQLLGVQDQAWSREIFEAAGLEMSAAPPMVRPGADIGQLQGPLASLPAFRETRLIVPACHDTASAIAGIPGQGEDWGFISSGTWSLVGCVLDAACVSDEARSTNFSNEGGVGGKMYFLKNVNGMWLLRQCVEHWKSQGYVWTVEQLIAACANLDAPKHLFDVDQPELLLPGDMPARINAQLKHAGRTAIPDGPEAGPQMANLIFHSLAARYAAVLQSAMSISGRNLKRLYVVGGGSRNTLLNQLTARATGFEVLTGSTESTTIGNFAVQLAALDGDYADGIGVSAGAVARWANVLAAPPVGLGNKIRAQKLNGIKAETGEALA